MSKEHVISKGVLEEVFGKNIRNISKIQPSNKSLLDYEHVIRDVCQECNSHTSSYDSRAKVFASETKNIYDATDFMLPTDLLLINWFIKTHMNYLRCLPDIETKERYKVNPCIYRRLLNYQPIGDKLIRFYIEGFQGLPYFWDENSDKRIPYFSYRSVRTVRQQIIISNFRFKFLDTFILLPSNNIYIDFERRCNDTIDEISREFGFNLQNISITEGDCNNFQGVRIERIVSSNTLINKVIRKDI